jgi:outer membrane protein assembly factor BamB
MKRNVDPQAGLLLLLLVLIAALSFPAQASRTREFSSVGRSELLKGELEGVGVTEEGTLVAAPSFREVFGSEVSYVWSLVPDGEGGVFAATGSDGKLYHIDCDGSYEAVAETFEYELFALARSADGSVYFAGAPNGTVTRLAPDGASETVIDLPEGLVWSLLVSPDGELFAATGDQGEIYRVRGNGETAAIGRVPDEHVVSLAWHEGMLLCGTDSKALLVAMDPSSGEQRILYDAPGEELVSILPLQSGSVLFAVNGNGTYAGGSSTGMGPLVLPAVEVHANASVQPSLYELLPSGLVRRVWRCPAEDILDLCVGPDGAILVGTGEDGVLYALDSLWNATHLLDLEESQLLSLTRGGRQVFVGTGNGGAVYCLDWDEPRAGTYVARVRDAGQTARWGTPRWVAVGHGSVHFETRSGQVEDPGESWSFWEALEGGRIVSPSARFLQWRMTLTAGATGNLRVGSIVVPYRGPNRLPRVTRVEISPLAPEFTSPTGGRGGPVRQTLPGGVQIEYTFTDANTSERGVLDCPGVWARTLRTAVWDAVDPDGDRLRFDLYLRFLDEHGSADDERFVPLKLDLEDTGYTWEAAAWPDGWYELKVVARDDVSNAPGEALSAMRLSVPFRVDNKPPRLLDLRLEWQQGELVLCGEALDEGGRIAGLAVSLDGEPWRVAYPNDGILDGPREAFAIAPGFLDDGRVPTVVAIRACDEVGHLAIARLRVPAQ